MWVFKCLQKILSCAKKHTLLCFFFEDVLTCSKLHIFSNNSTLILTFRRKNEAVNELNLLHLLSDRLLANCTGLTMATYNTLFEILIEQMSPEITFNKHEDYKIESVRFENSALLKVIANLITQSEPSDNLMAVKRAFLEDMIRYCRDSRENRR